MQPPEAGRSGRLSWGSSPAAGAQKAPPELTLTVKDLSSTTKARPHGSFAPERSQCHWVM